MMGVYPWANWKQRGEQLSASNLRGGKYVPGSPWKIILISNLCEIDEF